MEVPSGSWSYFYSVLAVKIAGLVQAIKQQITPCWKIQAGAKDAVKMQVAIRMRLNPDGSLGAVPQIQDQGRIDALVLEDPRLVVPGGPAEAT